MPEVRQTEEFSIWLRKLRDARARAKVAARIDRLAEGNPGDVDSVGDGISELRIHYGPGYRVYFVKKDTHFVLLRGGDKSSQDADIKNAKKLAETLE